MLRSGVGKLVPRVVEGPRVLVRIKKYLTPGVIDQKAVINNPKVNAVDLKAGKDWEAKKLMRSARNQ